MTCSVLIADKNAGKTVVTVLPNLGERDFSWLFFEGISNTQGAAL